VTRSRTPRDLRERMERVAAKPRQPAPKPRSPRRSQEAPATDIPVVDLGTARREPAAPRRPATARAARHTQPAPRPESHSRIEALISWGVWELTEVPARRWQWLQSVMRSGGTGPDAGRDRH